MINSYAFSSHFTPDSQCFDSLSGRGETRATLTTYRSRTNDQLAKMIAKAKDRGIEPKDAEDDDDKVRMRDQMPYMYSVQRFAG